MDDTDLPEDLKLYKLLQEAERLATEQGFYRLAEDINDMLYDLSFDRGD